ncbi:MAG: MATE family efflux transporter [Rhodothermales bacterium]|nr:MATE family efflux transporter [Rhodothermales bacterium]
MSLRREIRATLTLAAPVVLAQLAQVSLGFVDTVMVGRLGPEALAGVALGASMFFTLGLFGLGVVLAVGPMAAQAVGAGKPDEAAHAARQGLWATALLGPAMMVLLVGVSFALGLTGQDPAVADLAGRYLRAIVWGLPAFYGFVAVRSFAEALGRPLVVTLVAVLGIGSNVFWNDALIHGRYGLPALGPVGVGYASAITTWTMFGLLTLVFVLVPSFRKIGLLRRDRPDRAVLGALLRLGLPIGGSLFVEAGLFGATALLVGRLGSTALAAHQVALQMASITFMGALGIAIAGSVRVGHAAGAGDREGVRRAGWTSIGLSTGVMTVSALAFTLAPRPLIGLFLDVNAPANAAVVALATTLLTLAGVFQVFDGLQAGAGGALRGLKDTRAPMLIAVATYWGLGLTTGVWLAFGQGQGAAGLWKGLIVGLAAAGIALALRFWQRTKRLPKGQSVGIEDLRS